MCRWLQFSLGESLAFSYALSSCQNKVVQASARRCLKSKLADVRSLAQITDASEEVKLGLYNYIQGDDVSSDFYSIFRL
jgi:hypothetical protein